MSPVQTYRYKFTDTIVGMLTAFAKLHAHDDRHTYREAWNDWWTANAEILEAESRRLCNLGYVGDVQDKMYKAGRYYFRAKNLTKPDPQERRAYISMSPEIIEAMDIHIDAVMREEAFTPAKGYDWFCESHLELLRAEVHRLQASNVLTAEDLVSKVKKTYKNRYFLRR